MTFGRLFYFSFNLSFHYTLWTLFFFFYLISNSADVPRDQAFASYKNNVSSINAFCKSHPEHLWCRLHEIPAEICAFITQRSFESFDSVKNTVDMLYSPKSSCTKWFVLYLIFLYS